MRMIKYLLIICIVVELFVSCSNQKKRLKNLWKIEDSINYQNFTEYENEKLEKLLKGFSLEEKVDKLNWNSGYSQECYVLRKLYFEEIISRENFLNRCVAVYKRYESNQTNISFHTVGYAICLYYLGQTENANELFIKILDNSTAKYFTSKSDYEIIVAVCRKLLGIDNGNNSKLDDFFSYTTDDIINIFCGN